jgi:exonuclease III
MIIVEKSPRNSAGLNLQRRPGKTKVNDLRIATWNVLSLYRSGAYRTLGDVMKNNKVDIVMVQEVRLVGNEVLESKECTFSFYYSCHTEKHIFGTGFLVDKRTGHMILDFKPIGMRMCKQRLRGKFYNYSFFCECAPTDDKDEEQKREFL